MCSSYILSSGYSTVEIARLSEARKRKKDRQYKRKERNIKRAVPDQEVLSDEEVHETFQQTVEARDLERRERRLLAREIRRSAGLRLIAMPVDEQDTMSPREASQNDEKN